MAIFNKAFLDFFRDLEKNNSKEWFDTNRKVYEKEVKEPFKVFIQEMTKALQPAYPDVDLSKNTKIFRINRDIRFSADKTPYKIHMAGMIMPTGVGDTSKPGFYVQANHNDVRVYSGTHQVEKDQLQSIRNHIKNNTKRFEKLISDKAFTDTYSEILGDKNKRLPPEFKDLVDSIPLIANKSFYWYFKMAPKTITKDSLIDELLTRYKISLPINEFFMEAL